MSIISQFKKTLQNCLDIFVLPDTAVIAVSVINLWYNYLFSLVLSQLLLHALFY